MPLKPDYLFVYGTLLRQCNNDICRILEHSADFKGLATFQGRLFKIDYYPGVIPSNETNDAVQGEVYRLRHPELVLSQLDRYEECGPSFTEPTEYIRKIHSVRFSNGDAITAWIYIYNWPTDKLERIESGDFLKNGVS
ncbi:MAG: gamma-glutamylcyclotransferase [Methylococcaceae bacterium]|nr:gamma-glutamylcyclotransferase [Methylococcaceae bacterium]